MRRPEEILHRAVVTHLRARLQPPWLVFHVPNGGGRSKAEAGVLKALGVLAGMPDLLVVGPCARRPAGPLPQFNVIVPAWYFSRVIALELKAPPRKLCDGTPSKAVPAISDAQRDTIAALATCGIPTIIVRDLDEALAALVGLGVPLKGCTL